MAASGNRLEEVESKFRLITAAPRPKELTGAIDLINQFGLRAHHEAYCKKPLPASIAETSYLNNVVGDTEIRKGEGMELEQLIQEPPVMDIGFRIQPFNLETLRQALELRENEPIQLSEADRGLPTISGKVKSEHKDKEKKHKKRKDKEKDKDREHKKHKEHKHRHKDKDKEKDKDKKKDKSGSHENGDDKSKKHQKKKRKHDANEEEGDSYKHKKRKHKNSKGEDAGLTKNGN